MSSLWRPDYYVESVVDINPGWLSEHGIKGVVSDLDNTLSGWHNSQIPEVVREWLGALAARGIAVCILSNSLGHERAGKVEQMLGISVMTHGFKPLGRGYRRALALMGLRPAEAVGIGDQIRTDIVGAKRAGLMSILVNSLTDEEHWINARLRKWEECYLARVGLKPTVLRPSEGVR